MMRIFRPLNRFFFLIIFFQIFIGEAFAIDQISLRDIKINLYKTKKNNEITIYEKSETEEVE
jgi:hypothetical protein